MLTTRPDALPPRRVAHHLLTPSHLTGDRLFGAVTTLAALGVVALAGLIALALAAGARPALQAFGWRFLVGSTWDPISREFGALPYVYGTVVSALVALALAGPLGLGAAIFLSELAPARARGPLGYLIELLASIPSVVYGLWGLLVLAPVVRTRVEPALEGALGFLPLFQGPAYGVGLLTAGLVLAIMVLPTIVGISLAVLRAVPRAQREALYALGATRWEVVATVVLPAARGGILGGLILALGRALGETMAVTMVIGNRAAVSPSLFALGDTMASVIANQFTEAADPLQRAALIELGLVLFGVTALLNVVARLLVWRTAGARGGGR